VLELRDPINANSAWKRVLPTHSHMNRAASLSASFTTASGVSKRPLIYCSALTLALRTFFCHFHPRTVSRTALARLHVSGLIGVSHIRASTMAPKQSTLGYVKSSQSTIGCVDESL
jgi:hypothetical protein